jgi:hypothetical protein
VPCRRTQHTPIYAPNMLEAGTPRPGTSAQPQQPRKTPSFLRNGTDTTCRAYMVRKY